MNINLETLTVVELKALAFDIIVEQDRSNKNLQLINNELAKRKVSETKIEEPKKES